MAELPRILDVVPGSPASRAGLVPGDEIVAIDGVLPRDVIEYQALVDEPSVEVTVRRGGVEQDVVVVRGLEPFGLRLHASVFDRVQTCDNHCAFCFIYQLPPGMRSTLYLKDDDYRLSFLYGNFTTLTRFTELDYWRVVDDGLGPLYVSIHATNPDVRAALLANRRGGVSLRWLRRLLDAGVIVHGQIVVCPGVNDGEVLEETLAELLAWYPQIASVGLVPVGVSRYNTAAGMRPHTPAEAAAVVEVAQRWGDVSLRLRGRRTIFAADELYLQGGLDLPQPGFYEGFVQHENGVGMATALRAQIAAALAGAAIPQVDEPGDWVRWSAPGEWYRAPRLNSPASTGARERARAGERVRLVTGELGAAVLTPMLTVLSGTGASVDLLSVRNDFFGGNTAVTGLVTGTDLRHAFAAETDPPDRYLLPDVVLSGGRFLDDVTLDEVVAGAPAPVQVVATDGGALVAALRGVRAAGPVRVTVRASV